MAVKPETSFINSVHKHLPNKETLHREKMNNPYSSGTADVWYSGNKADLWVEYKYLPKVPVRALILPDLSPLQVEWLEGRYKEGRNVAVIVGCPQGGVLYQDLSWTKELTPEEFLSKLLTKQDLALWLQQQTIRRSNAKFSNPAS